MNGEGATSDRLIVLGLDGSDGAVAALEWCAKHAPVLDAEVVAVFGLNPLGYTVPRSMLANVPTWDQEAVPAMTRELDEWCSPLRAAGIAVSSRVELGTPADVLERVADGENAMMIVVGRHGRSGLAEMLLGSVPHTLTHRAQHPVLVVPSQ